jgi:hypothetical protein
VHKVELSLRALSVQAFVALHGRGPICTRFDDRDPVEQALVVFCVCLKRFDNKPPIRICLAYLFPRHSHVPFITASNGSHTHAREDFLPWQ